MPDKREYKSTMKRRARYNAYVKAMTNRGVSPAPYDRWLRLQYEKVKEG